MHCTYHMTPMNTDDLKGKSNKQPATKSLSQIKKDLELAQN